VTIELSPARDRRRTASRDAVLRLRNVTKEYPGTPPVEALLGIDRATEPQATARLAVPLAANDRRQDYLRAQTRHDRDGKLEVVPFAHQDSSMLSLLAQADCLVIRPPLAPAAQPGDLVPILPFVTGLASI